MRKLLTLGNIYVSDFIKDGESPRSGKHELKVVLDEKIGAPRLEKPPTPDEMFGKYWYRSGINQTMKNELKEIVDSITKIKKLKENDVWIDIASNDGTLLSFLPESLIRVGIDPVDDTFKNEAEKHSNLIIQDFFSSKLYKDSKFGKNKAKVITCIAMFYDIEDPLKFLKEVAEILEDGGVFVLQMSYTPLMINQLAFDNICHEHIWYYSLFNIKKLLEDSGFNVFNCELNDVNGGSFRVYSTLNTEGINNIGSQQYRDVSKFRVNSILEYEKTLNLNSIDRWNSFFTEIEELKSNVFNFIKEEKLKNKKIWAYGASTKGNTLLQYFGLDNTLIDGIAERSPYKWGLKTIGTNIPIYSEDEMRKENPDYLLVLPWHFINEFVIREDEFLKNGGTFIVPCPKFKLINYKNKSNK
jgi:NDP-4-keto-2,6-dideoxyhexose 3-C-methyltransferase